MRPAIKRSRRLVREWGRNVSIRCPQQHRVSTGSHFDCESTGEPSASVFGSGWISLPSDSDESLIVGKIDDAGAIAVVGSIPAPGDYSVRALRAVDVNRDGILDLLDAKNDEVKVTLGQNDGGWTPSGRVLGSDWYTDFVGDFNEDGFPDLVVATPSPTTSPSTLELFLGARTSAFSGDGIVVPSCDNSWDWLIGDLNEDGHLDLLQYGCGEVVTLLGHGDGTFSNGPANGLDPTTPAALVDVDGDGHLDFIGASGGSSDTSRSLEVTGKVHLNPRLVSARSLAPTTEQS